MTDRPFAGGADTAVGPTPGYYPDPSIPGFVRYWGGTAWVPGTSRPAPAEGEVLEPPRFVARRAAAGAGPGQGAGARYVPPPVVVEAAPEASGETGPVYLDQTAGGASFSLAPQVGLELRGHGRGEPLPAGGPVFRGPGGAGGPVASESGTGAESGPGPEAGRGGAEQAAWQVDPKAQRGLLDTGDAPRWVSWGMLPGQSPVGGSPSGGSLADGSPAGGSPAGATSFGEAPSEGVAEVRVDGSVEAHVDRRAEGGRAEAEAEPAGPVPAAPVAVVAAAPVPVVVPGPAVAAAAAAASASAAVPAAARPVVPGPAKAPAQRRPSARRRPAPRPPAGLGRRLVARLVDTAVLAVVATAAGIPLGNSVAAHLQQKLDQARMASALTRRQVQVWMLDGVVVGKLAVLLGILAFVGLLYEVLPTARTGQTFGKRLARIRVVDASPTAARGRLSLGRSLRRWLVRQLSAVLLIGLIWPVLDRPARRGWQDRAARTRVVRD
ncbi:RDD family protein [Kitasatospora sp. NPDC058170]|uniref:RDD family protein n=1 Tax=Kitasatospora sp. NPDC058170 TaxID=3346364 RepID=UPI0036DDDE05